MISKLIVRKFIKNYDDVKNKDVREKYGYLGGIIGILINLLLFGIKVTIGIFSNSIAVIADAFNNLSDVGSSVITIFGFKLASKPADREHPFGHGRIEYISGLIVAFIVMIVGFQFVLSSIERIKNPTPVNFSLIPFLLILVSILFKVWLSSFYGYVGKTIDSSALKASSVDALSDVISSSTVALSLLLSNFFSFPLDGYMGIVVSLIILYAGYNLVKDTLNPLLGMAPDKELVESIQKSVLSYDNICGVHDLMIHNYGPGRIIASIHAEVPCNISIVKIHEIIDKAEKEVSKELDIYLVIHMDPINTNSEDVLKDRNILDEVLKNFPIIKSIHDFRVVGEGEIKNLIFDAVIDVSHHLSKDEEHKLIKDIDNSIKKIHSKYNVIITIDKDYLGVE
ncbi:cation diffusion facilitator transporter family protein [Clostridium argentinense CDC 2741]|uniref:Cation diffusion facilitator transporter family protein n=1 Tax=Clostridium argentinense CDC 2741 TaxID=1418104 RepID=A0A0C1R7A2_9CLOT|nr:cation diffusion facilitator family transporter [Clostridium argentinense]ARC85831.1 cation-efflux pump [Clostridium argentinense]KIE46376.1 cation diffusion facilitator transporter family protein [Clostridium argentinense CDC 2741]NFF39914.1 cation transporter [Clostridium argentinense]NFP48545.1 cation transporter [Clostridium argentinense]NFP71187.1 cation transporter [Clostridium argentinense]